jgi:F0F1-type ATP synthase epsilon subunit
MKSRDEKELLEVKVFWLPILKEIFYQGEALTVSSQNRLGKFDVLPRHTNFITLIFNNLTIITPEKKKISYQFERGVLEVRENKLNIFLGL